MKPTRTYLSLCFALLASAALASPRSGVEYRVQQGKDAATKLDWEVRYVELTGGDPAIMAKVNEALRRGAFEPKRGFQELLEEDPGETDMPGVNGVYVDTVVGVATDELLSVSYSISTYFAGAAHPNTALGSATYDLRTGERVSPDAFFRAGKKGEVLQPIHDALTREWGGYLSDDAFAGRPTVADLGEVVVEPEGMTFLWGHNGLDAPYAAGPIVATLTWAELGDAVDREGILRSAIALDPAQPRVDLALGDGEGEDPDAPVTLDNPSELYLMGLQDQLQLVFAGLTVEERLALLRSDAWRSQDTSEDFLGALDELELRGLAQKVRATRETLRGHYAADAYAGLEAMEFMSMASELDYALAVIVSGRVVTSGNDLLVRGEPSPDGEWGRPIARLRNGAVVGVVGVAGDGLFHHVMLPDGTFGRVHTSYLLLETPVVDDQGRVYRQKSDGRPVFGTAQGPALIAKDGPGHADAQLEALLALVGEDGMSPPVNLIAIQRQIGLRPAWLAVVEFTDLSTLPDADQLGEGRPDTDGLTQKLPE